MKWEYATRTVQFLDVETVLNTKGEQGYELAAAMPLGSTHVMLMFKRQKQ